MPLLLSEVIKQNGDFEILSFEEAGVVVRALKEIYGRNPTPISKWIERSNLKPLFKEMTYNFFYNSYGGKYGEKSFSPQRTPEQKREVHNQVKDFLDKGNYPYVNSKHCIYIHIPDEINLAAFEGSDDPAVWRQRNQEIEDDKKVKKVLKKLDKEE